MNVLEIALWAVAATLSARLLVAPTPARWLTLGVVIGLGALTKYCTVMFPAGLCARMLAAPARRQFLTRWPWIAGAIAAAILAPHLMWEAQHGWPSIEFMRNATAFKLAAIGPVDAVAEQLLATNPILAIVWLAALVGLLTAPPLRPWRPHGVAFLVSALILWPRARAAQATSHRPT